MTSYATVEQYIARFGAVSNETVLQECLNDATRVINVALDRAGIDRTNPTGEFASNLMSVCRSMANRVMPNDTAMPQGVTGYSVGAVGFTESYNFATAYGTPKLLPSEMALLGIGGRIGVARPSYGRLEADDA